MDAKFINRWLEKANRSLFFLLALLFHLILFLVISTLIIFQPAVKVKEDFQTAYVPSAPPPPPPPQTSTPTMAVSPATVATTAPVISSQSSMATFSVPMPPIDATIDPRADQQLKVRAPSTSNIQSRMGAIRTTVSSWRTKDNIRNAGGDVHNLVARFPVYLAQYADGDWNCNNYYRGPDMVAGCLPDLVAKMAEWSKKGLIGQAPKAISISSPELISSPPPYIFFTGHRDFRLTDAEITNLQKYLQIGGAIWGDSAFAGTGSRFDVAFRREMKRVLPDLDKNFEVLPMDHPIFTHSWFSVGKIPTGMNYRADPVEVINLDGKLAVIYTPNDYSDMMTIALAPGDDEDSAALNGKKLVLRAIGSRSWSPERPLFTPLDFLRHAPTYFRNYTPASSMAVYKLSMNIIAHLLIRFDDNLLLTP